MQADHPKPDPYLIELRNLTTHVLIFPNEESKVDVVEISEDHLRLNVPKNSFRENHQILLKIRAFPKSRLSDFDVTGKVSDYKNVSRDEDAINIELTQYPQSLWMALVTRIWKKQLELHEFFKKVRF